MKVFDFDDIITERLVLRKFCLEDSRDMFFGWASDREVTKYLTWNPYKEEMEVRWTISCWQKIYQDPRPNTWYNLAIALKSTNQAIGSIAFLVKDEHCEIGYCLSKKYWHQGLTSEAFKALIQYLFSKGIKEIITECDEENIFSEKIMINNHMNLVKRYQYLNKKGHLVFLKQYSLKNFT